MNLLETINVSYDQLRTLGAENSYSPAVVKRFWGEKDELSLQEILAKDAHPHLITWILLRETIFPLPVLRRIALQMARTFIAAHREKWRSDVDKQIDELLDLVTKWLDKQIGDRDLEEGSRKAAAIYDFYQKQGNEHVASQAAVVRDLLSADTATFLWKVYYSTIESTRITRELVPNGIINEAWKERLAFVKSCCEELANEDLNPSDRKSFFSVNEKNQFKELHQADVFKTESYQTKATACANQAYNDKQDNELPVGSIIAYAAEVYRGQEPSGWLLCDGRELDRTCFADLFGRIGTAWGASCNTKFNIPDLRGMFLRATGDTNGINPDADKRTCSKIGGNKGDKVGSFQDFATRVPTAAFTGWISNASVSKCNYDAGCQDPAATYDGSYTETVQITNGGGKETRPENKAVHYLIKYARIVGWERVKTPLAAVFPTAVKSTHIDPTYWKICDGTELSKNCELFDKIRFIHGGKSPNECLLPDYRNMFLRGVSGSEGNDPDAGSRECPYSGSYPGNRVGIGSRQKDETARPKNPFSVNVHVPSGKIDKVIKGVIRDLYQYNDGSVHMDLSQGGGDAETSPVFVKVNWMILKNAIPIEKFPVGAVISFAGDKLEKSEVWMPCDGRSLEKEKYPQLYNVLVGKGKEEKFNLPDYRGFFLRGANNDMDLGTKQLTSTTRNPTEHFCGNIPHLPVSSVGVSGETRYSGAAKNGNAAMESYKGGDSESRPKNCAVNYYIRVLESR